MIEYVIVKLPEFSNRAELREVATSRVIAVGSLQAMRAVAGLFGKNYRTQGYASCCQPNDDES